MSRINHQTIKKRCHDQGPDQHDQVRTRSISRSMYQCQQPDQLKSILKINYQKTCYMSPKKRMNNINEKLNNVISVPMYQCTGECDQSTTTTTTTRCRCKMIDDDYKNQSVKKILHAINQIRQIIRTTMTISDQKDQCQDQETKNRYHQNVQATIKLLL